MTTGTPTRALAGAHTADGDGGARRVRLTGRANRFLAILRDFGHLTDEQVDALLVALTEAHGGETEVVVDLPLVRTNAAAILFRNDPAGEDGTSLLAEDWPFLFY